MLRSPKPADEALHLYSRAQLGFFQHTSGMVPHGVQTYSKLFRYFAIRRTPAEQQGDLCFAISEPIMDPQGTANVSNALDPLYSEVRLGQASPRNAGYAVDRARFVHEKLRDLLLLMLGLSSSRLPDAVDPEETTILNRFRVIGIRDG